MLLPDDIEPPPFTDEDLEAYFAFKEEGYVDEDDNNAPGFPIAHKVAAWSVCDTGSAEYAMRKLAHAEALIAQRKEEAEAFKAQIERWLAGEIARPKKAVNFFTGQLEAYARRKREEDEILTLNLPSGQVTSRRNPARPAVAEDKPTRSAFIEWARARELPLVKPTWAPVMDEIKKRVAFRTVIFPKIGTHGQRVHDVGDHLIVVLASMEENAEVMLEGLEGDWVEVLTHPETGAFEERHHVAICQRDDGSWWLVPGVVQVPEEVTYTVKPAKP